MALSLSQEGSGGFSEEGPLEEVAEEEAEEETKEAEEETKEED
jgi:hypothetical protein